MPLHSSLGMGKRGAMGMLVWCGASEVTRAGEGGTGAVSGGDAGLSLGFLWGFLVILMSCTIPVV